METMVLPLGRGPLKKRNDSPGYPGDDRVTQRYNEPNEMVQCEQRGLPEAELDRVMRSTYEGAVRRYPRHTITV
jgi:hypothetical protein